jgi:hypothetical protein
LRAIHCREDRDADLVGQAGTKRVGRDMVYKNHDQGEAAQKVDAGIAR